MMANRSGISVIVSDIMNKINTLFPTHVASVFHQGKTLFASKIDNILDEFINKLCRIELRFPYEATIQNLCTYTDLEIIRLIMTHIKNVDVYKLRKIDKIFDNVKNKLLIFFMKKHIEELRHEEKDSPFASPFGVTLKKNNE